MSEIITMRDIDTITTEIKTIEGQVQRFAIYGCIEIGKRLVEAKEMVGYGGWGKYLEEKVSYSQQWATNLMNLYKEYGSAQESLFENFANSQSFGNIDVTKHILLLSVPAEEREAFATEHDAENASTRELQAAIRERGANLQAAKEQTARADEAESKVADLKKKLADTADQLDIAGDKLLAKEERIKQLQEQAEAATKKEADAAGKVDKLKQKLKAAKDAEKAAKDALAEAKAKPEIPESMMEEMRQQVAADAAAKATEDLQKQLADAQAVAAQAEQKRKDTEAALAEAEKKAKLASGDMALVNAYLEGMKDQFNKMVGAIKKVELADPETGKKLRQNVKDKLLPALQQVMDAV